MATIPIGEVAARTGLATSAIRFYEEAGLVRPARDGAGRRRFHRSDIRRLSFVLVAQQLGFTLAEIRGELERLPEGRPPTKADWSRIARHFRRSLDERIATLERLRDRLDGCIGCGCLSLQACQLYNPGDRAAGRGAGPRYLVGDP